MAMKIVTKVTDKSGNIVKAQIALINKGTSHTKHVVYDKQSGKLKDARGLLYPIV